MGEPIRYEDFAISIEGTWKEGFKVRVEASPLDRAICSFELPELSLEASCWLADLESAVRGLPSATHEDGSWIVEDALDQEGLSLEKQRGAELFQALFRGEIGTLWHQCLALLDQEPLRGLRLRLIFDRSHNEAFERLAFLPWELLWDPERKRFLGRDRRTPVVRHVVTRMNRKPESAPGGIKVLLATPQPAGLPPLDMAREGSLVRKALRRIKGIRVVPLPQQTLAGLRDAVDDENPHVVHLMGHGGFEAGTGRGGIYLEDEKGQPHLVTGEVLGEYLSARQKPAIIVLNACATAMPRWQEGIDPHSHVADQLVAMGYTTVVAMQFSISDAAAIAFGQALYEALAAGYPIDGAVAEARLRLAGDPAVPGNEWATPVLYMRSLDGVVLERVKADGGRLVSVRPIRTLGIRSRWHEGDQAEVFVDRGRLLELTHLFDGRYVKSAAAWEENILPDVCSFLHRERPGDHEVQILFDAHLTIAIIAGWWNGLRGSQPVTVLQRRPWDNPEPFRFDETRPRRSRPYGELWQEESIPIDSGGDEIAIVVSIARCALTDAKQYVTQYLGGRVREVLSFEIQGGVGHTKLESGRDTLELVEALDGRITALGYDQLTRTKHLFLSAPVSFAYALGAYVRGWGPVQLYEHDLERTQPKAYAPSLLLEPAQLQAPSFGE